MAAYVVCDCCGSKIPTTTQDVGKAVVCPVSRKLVMVYAGNVFHTADRAERVRSRWPLLALALLLLAAFLGAGGFLAWDRFGKSKPSDDTAAAAPAPAPAKPEPKTEPKPEPVEPKPTPEKKATETPKVVKKKPPEKKSEPKVEPKPKEPENKMATVPPKIEPKPAPALIDTTAKSPRGLPIYFLVKRRDLRSTEELDRDLLSVREVALDIPTAPNTSRMLFDTGTKARQEGKPYFGPVIAAKDRSDLAGLPFRIGAEADLTKVQAEGIQERSAKLRSTVQSCIPSTSTDPRPDPDKLFIALLRGNDALVRDVSWTTDEAVPAIQKLLQHDSADVRRQAIEALRAIVGPVSTQALCRAAVFDTSADNRAAAVHALIERPRTEVNAHLLELIRYPWPRAADHAAEALVALHMKEAVPTLVTLLGLPDPDAPQAPEAGGEAGNFRREMVRVNTARNCLMCHAPSPAAEPLRAAIPEPGTRLPQPANEIGSTRFVHAGTTYLKHDFSASQSVATAGAWPQNQRFDFLVGVYPTDAPVPAADAPSPYREAVLWALRELTGENLGTTLVAWDRYRGDAIAPEYRLTRWTNWYRTVYADPNAILTYWGSDWGAKFLWLELDEQSVVLSELSRIYGPRPTYNALITYLEQYARYGDERERERAIELLKYYRGRDYNTFIDRGAAGRIVTKTKNPYIRSIAIRDRIGRGGVWSKEYSWLLDALKDDDVNVRLEAALGLRKYTNGSDDLYDALARATADPDPRVRIAAAESLQKLKPLPRSTVKPLAEGLVKKGTWDSAEQRAGFEKTMNGLIEDINHSKSAGYPTILAAACGDVPCEVPPATLSKLLAKMGPPTHKDQLPKLVTLLLKDDYKAVAKDQLLAAGDEAVPPLIRALKDPNPKLRMAAADVLGVAASGSNRASIPAWNAARDALADAKATDESAEVKKVAADSLAKLIKDAPR